MSVARSRSSVDCLVGVAAWLLCVGAPSITYSDVPVPSGQPSVDSGPASDAASCGRPWSLDFSSYSAGDELREFGDRNVVLDTADGMALTSSAPSAATVSLPVDLRCERRRVDVSLKFPKFSGQKIALLDGTLEVASVLFKGGSVSLSGNSMNKRSAGWKGGQNQVTIELTRDRARLYINGSFSVLEAVANRPISAIVISGMTMRRDYLYQVAAESSVVAD